VSLNVIGFGISPDLLVVREECFPLSEAEGKGGATEGQQQQGTPKLLEPAAEQAAVVACSFRRASSLGNRTISIVGETVKLIWIKWVGVDRPFYPDLTLHRGFKMQNQDAEIAGQTPGMLCGEPKTVVRLGC
jgi:hypothetical protein